jgi:hypothetical protein
MRVRTSLLCAFVAVNSVACGDKGSGNGDEETGGSSSAGTSTNAGTSSAGTSSGKAGDTASGGSSAGTSSSAGASKVFSFDTDVEKFKVQDSSAATDVVPVPKADVMLSFNADDGSPDPGSLQLDIPYSAASQYVSAGVNLDEGMTADLTGKKLKAMVKIVSGYGSEDDIMTAPGNAKLYIKTGTTYVYASASVANITAIGTWAAIEFDPEFPGYQAEGDYNIKDMREIGIQMDTNSASTTAAPAVVLIDSISY